MLRIAERSQGRPEQHSLQREGGSVLLQALGLVLCMLMCRTILEEHISAPEEVRHSPNILWRRWILNVVGVIDAAGQSLSLDSLPCHWLLG